MIKKNVEKNHAGFILWVFCGLVLLCFSSLLVAEEGVQEEKDPSLLYERHTIVNEEDLYLEYITNGGEEGVDENGDEKKSNGVDDDEDGVIDNHEMWYFHIVDCAGFVFGDHVPQKNVVMSRIQGDETGEICDERAATLIEKYSGQADIEGSSENEES